MVGSKSIPDSWFIDGNFNGISEEFFDDVVECLDLPLEDFEGNVGGEDWNARLQSLEPPSMDILASFSSGYCGRTGNVTSKPDQNLSLSYERTQIKQEPNSANTTSSISIPLNDDYSDVKHMHLFKTSSPVSILESSSSCFVENQKTVGPKFAPVKRARSKRSRPSGIKRHFALPFISPTSSASENLYISAASESDSETYHTDEIFKAAKRKQNRKKNLLPLPGVEGGNLSSSSQEPHETKKCMHCEVTSTPQWREGPMGPKTLCNACGVRYRSGRLFPEYRPAASPTFIPSVHSNSHRKVVEMRSKASQGSARVAAMGTLSSVQPGNRLDSLII